MLPTRPPKNVSTHHRKHQPSIPESRDRDYASGDDAVLVAELLNDNDDGNDYESEFPPVGHCVVSVNERQGVHDVYLLVGVDVPTMLT